MKPGQLIERAAALGVAETTETRWVCGDYGSSKEQGRAARIARALLVRGVCLGHGEAMVAALDVTRPTRDRLAVRVELVDAGVPVAVQIGEGAWWSSKRGPGVREFVEARQRARGPAPDADEGDYPFDFESRGAE